MKLVTIIITTYYRYEYLVQAIESVLMQDYPNKEIIVVDDNSNKEISEKIANINGIFYIRNDSNLGASKSRKKGFEFARGEYVIFMDDDDFYIYKHLFSKSRNIFNTQGLKDKLVFVSGNAYLLLSGSNSIIEGTKLNFNGLVQKEKYISGFQYKYQKPYSTFTTIFSTDIIRNNVISKTDMFNDTIIYINALLYGNIWFIEDIIGLYRIHENNISKNIDLNFLIDNLYEKYKVAKDNPNIFSVDPQFWLFNQFKLTYDYYIIESKPILSNYFKLLIWIVKHLQSYKYKFKFIFIWCKDVLKMVMKKR